MTFLFLVRVFVLGSMVGWIIDTTYRTIEEKKYNEGSVLGAPFLPIYGFGALLLVVTDSFLPEPLVARFLAYAVMLGALEYIGGVFTLHIFKKRYWDYSSAPFNLHGHTDLWHILLWGILGVTVSHFLEPILTILA